MRRGRVALAVRAGVVVSLLIGAEQAVFSDAKAPSSVAIIEPAATTDSTAATSRRWRRRRTTTTSAAPAPTTAVTAPATTVKPAPTVAPPTPAPTTRPPATTATTAAPTPTTRATTTTTRAATTTTHNHTTPGSYPPVWTPSPGPRNGEAFVENFDADPSTPQPWRPSNWDIQYHTRDFKFWAAAEPMMGHNGPNCESAPAEHRITTWADSTYVCLHHMMTAVNGTDYGAIYLTPPAMLDFATEGTVSWMNSTLLTSDRDWQDLWITPYAQNLATPLYDWLPDLQGEPATSVHITRDFGRPGWLINVVRNHVSTQIATLTEPADLPRTQAGMTAYELRLTRTGLRFGLPERNLWVTASFADLGFTTGVVQFGHHSYNPTKNGGSNIANSWSWDSFRIAPTKPLAIAQASPRLVSTDGGSITFPAAPANASLRFSGVCSIEMDTGSGYKKVTPQPQERYSVGLFSSYFVPIAAGTTTARFRFAGEGWYVGYPCAIKDAAVWSAP
jgi:hypothetical protein